MLRRVASTGKLVFVPLEYNLEECEQGSCGEVINSFLNYSGQTHVRRRKINFVNLSIPQLPPCKRAEISGYSQKWSLLLAVRADAARRLVQQVAWVDPRCLSLTRN